MDVLLICLFQEKQLRKEERVVILQNLAWVGLQLAYSPTYVQPNTENHKPKYPRVCISNHHPLWEPADHTQLNNGPLSRSIRLSVVPYLDGGRGVEEILFAT